MSSYSLSEALREMVPAIKENKLIIMAGSGISMPSGIPTWPGLLSDLLQYCQDNILTILPASQQSSFQDTIASARTFVTSDPVKVASVLTRSIDEFRRYLPGHVYQMIVRSYNNYLVTTFSVNRQPNENHKLIVQTKYPFILTTNFDNLLEIAANEAGFNSLASYSFSYHEAELFAGSLYNEMPCIVHLHGNIRHIETYPLIFTTQDYHNVRKNYAGFKLAIQAIYMRYTVLFVGYGGNDPHLTEFEEDLAFLFDWPSFPDFPNRHFLALPESEAHPLMTTHKSIVNNDIIKLNNVNETTELLRQIQDIYARS